MYFKPITVVSKPDVAVEWGEGACRKQPDPI